MDVRHPDQLYAALDALERGDVADAARTLREAVARSVRARHPDDLLHLVFADALAARLPADARPWARVRGRTLPPHRADALATRLPHVSLGTALRTTATLAATAARPRVHVLDLAPGTGRQVVGLVGALSARADEVDDLAVVSVDPRPLVLSTARRDVLTAAERAGVRCQVHAVAEPHAGLGDAQWRAIGAVLERPVVLATGALARLPDAPARDALLGRLRALDPDLLLVSEPDVDLAEPDLRARFTHCWRHHAALFGLLGALDLTPTERETLALDVFGDRVRDAVGAPEAARALRHRAAPSWARALRRAGFAHTPGAILPSAPPPPSSPHVTPRRYAGYVGLDRGERTLTALFAYTPT